MAIRKIMDYTSNSKYPIICKLYLIFILLPLNSKAVPISIQKVKETGNNSVVIYERLPLMPPDSACRYKAQSYLAGDEVPTEEPCLRCQCKKQAVVCKLRICTPVPDAPPPGCVVVQKAKSCCPKLVCPESRKISREQRLSSETNKNETMLGIPLLTGQGFCMHEGSIYAEGSAMKSNSSCDHCFCIRGAMKCSQPQCIIPLNGCKPRYRSFACCPTNYDCTESNTSAIIQSTDFNNPLPQFLKGCRVLGRFIYEGEPVLPLHLEPDKEHLCQTCFCLGGIVRCRPLECARPIDGCEPVTSDGHCCPSRYECPLSLNNSILLEKGLEKLNKVENLLSLESQTTFGSPGEANPLKEKAETIDEPTTTNPDDLSNMSSSHVMDATTVTTVTIPLSLAFDGLDGDGPGGESELLFNKLRSDIGSREERQQNRDRDDILSKTSYEDDERDYLFGVPSLEAIDHYLISKMAFEGLSDPKMKRLKSIRPVGDNITGKVFTSTILGSKVTGVPESGEGNGNEMKETTAGSEMLGSSSSSLQPPLESVDGFSFKVFQNLSSSSLPLENENIIGGKQEKDEEIPNSTTQTTSNGGEEIQEIHQSTESVQKSNIFLQKIPTLENRTTTETREKEELDLRTTTTISPEATVANLEFIPFSVEDALLLPLPPLPPSYTPQNQSQNPDNLTNPKINPNPNPNPQTNPYPQTNPDSPPLPIMITYDHDTVHKSSLIPPLLQIQSQNPFYPSPFPEFSNPDHLLPEFGKNSQENDHPIKVVASPHELKDSYRNVIMDIPVSTSFYNNGYYQNGIITNSGQVPTNISSFPGQVFDDSGENPGEQKPMEQIPVQNPKEKVDLSKFKSTSTEIPPNNVPIIQNPSRTYSKFGVNDSPSYRHEATTTSKNNTNGENVMVPPIGPLAPMVPIAPIAPVSRKPPSLFDYGDLDSMEDDDQSFGSLSVEKGRGSNEIRKSSSLSNFNEKEKPIRISSDWTNPTKTHNNMAAQFPSYRSKDDKKLSPTSSGGHLRGTVLKPVVAFPFRISQKPKDPLQNLGVLKLSGCNIYGKMQKVGTVIRELSGPCIQCQCTENGVQCTERSC